MRLIDADSLKEALAKNKIIWTFNVNYDGLLAELIDNAPTVELRDNYDIGYAEGHIDGVLQGEKLYAGKCLDWIPTSEILPEEYGSYLVMWRSLTEGYPDRLFYEICEYDPDEDEWERIEQAGEAGAEIVAWMPLPEPYKKGGAE